MNAPPAAAHAYLEAPLRRPTSLLVSTLLVLAVAVAAGVLLPKRYRAAVLVGAEPAADGGTPAPQADGAPSNRWLQRAGVRMLSRSHLERVAEETNAFPGSVPRDAGESLRAAVSVRPVGADGLRVECVHGDPDTAALVANRVATLFVEEAERERQKWAVHNPEEIEARLTVARQAMEENEAAVRRFLEQGSGRASAPAPSTQAALRLLEVERQSVSGQVVAARGRAEILRAAIEQTDDRRLDGAGDTSVELEQLRARLAQLRTRYTDRYPDVQTVLRRIQELEAAPPATLAPASPDSASQAELAKVEQEIEALKKRVASIDAEIRRLQKLAAQPVGTTSELAAPVRDYDQAQESYLALMKEWTDARAAQSLVGIGAPQRFRILEPARIPERPFFPSLWAFTLAGLLAGLALGLVVACTREFLDHSVKGPEDLEDIFPQPLLATIPHVG